MSKALTLSLLPGRFAVCFALYQQRLIRRREPEKCFEAFLNNNWFGASVFVGIALTYIFR